MFDTLEYVMGSRVRCAGERCGRVESVVVDPVAGKLTHLVVVPDDGEGDGEARLVPVHLAAPSTDSVDLNCTRERFEEFEPAEQTRFLQGGAVDPATGGDASRIWQWPYFGVALTPGPMGTAPAVDPEPPITTVEQIPAGEVGVRRGERVHAVDGEIGRVRGLVVVPPDSAVTHVLLDEGHLWGRKRVAIPIRDVAGIDQEGVSVRLSKDEIKDLPPVDVAGLEDEGASD